MFVLWRHPVGKYRYFGSQAITRHFRSTRASKFIVLCTRAMSLFGSPKRRAKKLLMKLKHTDWKSLPCSWNLNDEVDHRKTSGISFVTNKQMLSMEHEYIARKYQEVSKNKNHCKKKVFSLNFSKEANKIIVLAHAVFIVKLRKILVVANSLFPYENLRYIVIIKRILLVKLETDRSLHRVNRRRK